MRKVIKKGKANGFEVSDNLAMLGTMFSMFCIMCTNKGIFINLNLIIFSNYVVIGIMLMFICVYKSHRLTKSSWIIIIYVNVYMYVCMYVIVSQIIRDHSCEEIFSYASERHEEVYVYDESSGQSSPDRSIRLVSCGYGLILCGYTMVMFMLWIDYVEGYIG